VSAGNMIKVALVDDHALVLESIAKAMLGTSHLEVWATFSKGEDFLSSLAEPLPHVAIIDYHLPDMTGGQIVQYLSYHYPDIKPIVLTGFDKPGLFMELVEAGCAGYMFKSSATGGSIIEAIEKVADGSFYLDETLRHVMRANAMPKIQEQKKPTLTQRELDVLTCIVDELSSQEIAAKLCISKRTVDNHRNSIMLKLGARNIVALIKLALQMKLV